MNVVSPDSVILFNYRHKGPDDVLDKLVFISGRKGDGVKAIYNILKDAMDNHNQTCLKIPKHARIKLTSKNFKGNKI